MKFAFFPVSENGKNGLGDEGSDGAMPPPRNFGLEPPLFAERRRRKLVGYAS